MPPSLYSNPRSRSYTNISHTVIKCSSDSKKDNDNEKANSENSRTRTLPLPPKHKRRGNLPPLLRAPSQANMHHTTVPQSIVPSKLGSQHQPTRTSLRHSRMIGTGARCGSESTPLLLWLSVAQLVLAVLLTLSAIVRMAITVQPMAQDWPSYTGPMVFFTSLIMLLYSWTAKGQNLMAGHGRLSIGSVHGLKVSCLIISSISSLVCLISSTCQLLHLLTYLSSTCSSPPSPLSCTCLSQTKMWQGGKLIYPGLGCHQLEHLSPLMAAHIVINILSTLISILFILIITFKRFNHSLTKWISPVRDESLAPMINWNNNIFYK